MMLFWFLASYLVVAWASASCGLENLPLDIVFVMSRSSQVPGYFDAAQKTKCFESAIQLLRMSHPDTRIGIASTSKFTYYFCQTPLMNGQHIPGSTFPDEPPFPDAGFLMQAALMSLKDPLMGWGPHRQKVVVMFGNSLPAQGDYSKPEFKNSYSHAPPEPSRAGDLFRKFNAALTVIVQYDHQDDHQKWSEYVQRMGAPGFVELVTDSTCSSTVASSIEQALCRVARTTMTTTTPPATTATTTARATANTTTADSQVVKTTIIAVASVGGAAISATAIGIAIFHRRETVQPPDGYFA